MHLWLGKRGWCLLRRQWDFFEKCKVCSYASIIEEKGLIKWAIILLGRWAPVGFGKCCRDRGLVRGRKSYCKNFGWGLWCSLHHSQSSKGCFSWIFLKDMLTSRNGNVISERSSTIILQLLLVNMETHCFLDHASFHFTIIGPI